MSYKFVILARWVSVNTTKYTLSNASMWRIIPIERPEHLRKSFYVGANIEKNRQKIANYCKIMWSTAIDISKRIDR